MFLINYLNGESNMVVMVEREKSDFNMAVSYLNRLNTLFYTADEASMTHNIYQWFNALLNILRELSTEMKEDELESKKKEAKDIFADVNKHVEDMNKSGLAQVTPELYWKLHNFELFLRGVLKESGLQMKMAEDARHALK